MSVVDDVVYFVSVKAEKDDEEVAMGVYSRNLANICWGWRNWGHCNNRYYQDLGAVEYIRVVERIWADREDGQPREIISDTVYNQRDMRRIGRERFKRKRTV